MVEEESGRYRMIGTTELRVTLYSLFITSKITYLNVFERYEKMLGKEWVLYDTFNSRIDYLLIEFRKYDKSIIH